MRTTFNDSYYFTKNKFSINLLYYAVSAVTIW